jgi:predicted transposase/invertase (TIGR01784 family)
MENGISYRKTLSQWLYYFEIPRIAQMLSDRYFYLVNLNKEADETLASHGHSAAWDDKFVKLLKDHGPLLGDMSISDIFILSLNYALEVGKDKAEDIIEAFLAMYPQKKEPIMTAARQLERKGRQEGKKERNLEIAKTMLSSGYKAEEMARLTGLSMSELHKL